MVLFKEDDIRFKKPKKERSRLRKWLTRIFWTFFVIGLLIFGGLTILSSFNGQSSIVKSAFEDYLTAATGYKTTLNNFNYMGFYPNVEMDLNNIVMVQNDKTISIGTFKTSIDFWRIAFGSIVFKEFIAENIKIPAGVIAPRSMMVAKFGIVNDQEHLDKRLKEIEAEMDSQSPAEAATKLDELEGNNVDGDLVESDAEGIEDHTEKQRQAELKEKWKYFSKLKKEDFRAHFIIQGTYGQYPLDISMGLEVAIKSRGRVEYKLPDSEKFSIKFGELEAAGTYKRESGSFRFDFEDGGIDGQRIGGAIRPYWSNKRYGADGFLTSGSSRVDFDVVQTALDLKGDISFAKLDFEDLQAPLAIFETLSSHIEDQEQNKENIDEADSASVTLPKTPMELNIEIKEVVRRGENIGHLKLPVKSTESDLTLGPIEGKLANGQVSGQIQLKSDDKKLWVFQSDGNWKSWNYALFQGFNESKALADMSWSLSGQGQTWDTIKSSYNGHITLIAGQGKMPSSALNVWGAGLVNAMLPSLDSESETDLNCMIADFRVDGGIAKPSPLFLDTKRVTVVGDGSYDILKDKLDLTLEPNSKNAALFDVAPAVSVTGSLAAPQIGVSTTSVFKKVGGLALGAINPAFLVVTMTDLGVGDDHPCREFIGGGSNDNKTSEEDEAQKEQETKQRSAGNE